jgi:hypothetical protein
LLRKNRPVSRSKPDRRGATGGTMRITERAKWMTVGGLVALLGLLIFPAARQWRRAPPAAPRLVSVEAAGVPHDRQDVTLAGQPAAVLVPRGLDPDRPVPLVVLNHGAGETYDQCLREPSKQGVLEALLADRCIVAASDAHGDNWGSPAAEDDLAALIGYAKCRYRVSAVVGWGQSMGALAVLLSQHDGAVRWDGLYLVAPVCSLRAAYDRGFAPGILAAYGVASYGAIPPDRDPAALAWDAAGRTRFRIVASPGDTFVPPGRHADVLLRLVRPYAIEAGVEGATGEHGDPSHYAGRAGDVVGFVRRCG